MAEQLKALSWQPHVYHSRGVTVQLTPERWEKAEWALDVAIPSGLAADDALKDLERLLGAHYKEFLDSLGPVVETKRFPTFDVKTLQVPVPPAKTEQPELNLPTPELSASYLDGLSWKTEPWGMWLRRDTPDLKALSKALEAVSGKTLVVGNYRYKISQGETAEFINRFPVEAGKK